MALLQRLIGVLLALVFLAAVLVFASLLLAVLVAAGIVVGGWMWWRTRTLRASGRRDAVVVEGEYRIEKSDRP